ncbi:hypothetical protein [Streptomyces sp. NPDC127105]|uniref:hypothetical protein n=1 Tax=Streptomyces sp. NPDC127105 TaxID=3345359 RepID=UPI003667B11D
MPAAEATTLRQIEPALSARGPGEEQRGRQHQRRSHRHGDEEHPASAQVLGQHTAGRQAGGKPDSALDPRQGDVHDGRIEHHHELRDGDHSKSHAAEVT